MRTVRHECSTCLVCQQPNAFWVVRLSRNQNFQIIRQADQTPVEHPMRGSGKRDSVRQDIRAVGFNRPDMGSVDLSAAATIDKLQACEAWRTSRRKSRSRTIRDMS